jgi:hypothetical protein
MAYRMADGEYRLFRRDRGAFIRFGGRRAERISWPICVPRYTRRDEPAGFEPSLATYCRANASRERGLPLISHRVVGTVVGIS